MSSKRTLDCKKCLMPFPIYWLLGLVNPTLILALLLAMQFQSITSFASDVSTGMPFWEGLKSYATFGTDLDATNFSWFDRTNRLHLRDIPTIHYLDRIVDRIAKYTCQEVTIMSKKMGMVSYSIAKNHYGQVRLIDRVGLINRDFTNYQITSNLSKKQEGLDMSYAYYFDNMIPI